MDFLNETQPDVLCLQETKCHPGDVAHIEWPEGYTAHFSPAVKKGYSGTGIITRREPLSLVEGIGIEEHDQEGRTQTLEFADFYLVNVYVPNAQHELRRLDYRQRWDADFCAYLKGLEKRKPVVFCGDLNVAHQEIDLARPKPNVGNPGFTVEERAGFDRYVEQGFIDTFREFEPSPHHYSWWSYRANARANNVGWRIDYFLTSTALRPQLERAWIMPEVMGSDHCPVALQTK
jgi:exodeoxyribonuclease-3